jgi:hypothetical protein
MLNHRTIYSCHEDLAVKLPLTEELLEYHKNGEFPLLENPNETKKAVIIGMFVLRPGSSHPLGDDLLNHHGYPEGIYDEKLDWVYNLDGLDGGWLIANLNSLDAYRLGMQYGVSDAVMISSNTVCAEGVTTPEKTGYIWQPYGPLSWPSVTKVDSNMVEKVENLRNLWQTMGFLSSRKYPAQMVVTHSGKTFPDSPDFLSARIFHDYHPNGDRIEVYIVTTAIGAKRIVERASQFQLEDRIQAMLIILPHLSDEKLDLSSLPALLYEKYSMKIINHDGGQKILRDFSTCPGLLTQMNLTLGRKWNLNTVLENFHTAMVPEEKKKKYLTEFQSRVRYFFSSPSSSAVTSPISEKRNHTDDVESDSQKMMISYGVPKDLKVSYCVEDESKEVVIVTLNTKHGFDFYRC